MPNLETATHNTLEEAAILNRLVPGLADQPRIESSVIHAENTGEKHVRASNERRISAHLSRMAKLLGHAGVESRVWESAVEELIVDADNIPETYWKQQAQIARDQGLGDVRLGQNEITKQLRDAQRTGLTSWRDYLERAGEQYPLWFKFYAWDGMSRLGTFNKEKGYFSKRSVGTVAPYPQLNPAALAKVFEAVADQGADPGKIAQLAKAGNFNKLYSHMLLEQNTIIPTPEKAKDVRGEWKTYTKDDTQAITEAAEGTPWCIAGKNMAVHYTRDGGSFLLFHLEDPETGKISPTAAASIRLDEKGMVVELSGLKGGSSQYLEDSLIPTVEEKVGELPGGKRYLKAFEDKQKLILMDKKFQSGEPFSVEEIRFLYEVERPIEYLDTYRDDPRPAQFMQNKHQHVQQIAASEGLSIMDAELVLMSDDNLNKDLWKLLDQGYNATTIANRLSSFAVLNNLDRLIDAGAEIDLQGLYEGLDLNDKLTSFSKLKDMGAELDPDELANSYSPTARLSAFGRLVNIGARIDPNDLAVSMDEKTKLKELGRLIEVGAQIDVDQLLTQLHPKLKPQIDPIDFYLKHGAKSETIKSLLEISFDYRSSDLEVAARKLLQGGFSSDQTMSFLASAEKTYRGGKGNFESGDDSNDRLLGLLKAGIDANALLRSGVFGEHRVERNLQALLDADVNLGELMSALGAYHTAKHVDDLVKAGADISDIVAHIKETPKYLLDNFERLNKKGANLSISEVISMMGPDDILTKIPEAAKLGAKIDVNKLLDDPRVTKIWTHTIGDLLAAGADIQKIAEKMKPLDIGYHPVGGKWMYSGSRYDNYLRDEYPEVYKLAYGRIMDEIRGKVF